MTNILEILGTNYDPERDRHANLKAAKLAGWNVRNVPVYAVMSDRDIPMGRTAIVRTSPHDRTKRDVLGETKGRFELLDNEGLADRLELLRTQVNEAAPLDLEWNSLGEAERGRKVFMALYSERLEVYLIAQMSYDQTLQTSIQVAFELPGGGLMNFDSPQESCFPLSTPAVELAEHVRRLREEFLGLQETHSADTYSKEEAQRCIERALGLPSGEVAESTSTRYKNKAEQVMKFLHEEGTYTRWDMLAALCAWVDFAAPVRKAKLGELKALRAEQGLFRPYRKQDAFNRLINH